MNEKLMQTINAVIDEFMQIEQGNRITIYNMVGLKNAMMVNVAPLLNVEEKKENAKPAKKEKV